ncbi:DAK2 domain-containing protein, partial [Jatrophihabitans sp. YIM 134969]
AARAALERPAPGSPGAADAGADGLVLVLEALADVLSGVPLAPVTAGGGVPAELVHAGSAGGPAYEVQYLLELPPDADAPHVIGALADRLRPLGDSLVLADDGAGAWAVHVHVDDVGAAVEAGAAGVAHGGAMSQVRVTRFAETVRPARQADGRRVAVVAAGDDLHPARGLFRDLEVTVLGPGEEFPAGELVVVAVGEAAITAAMRHADRTAGVTVVPARALVQALAAVAVHDPSRRGVDDTVAMAEAAAGCRHASLGVAAGDALTIVGVAHAGDVLGLLGDEIAVIGADDTEVARRLLDRLLAAGGELVTLLHRTDAAGLAAHLADHVHALGDHLDVEVRDVGPHLDSPVLVGVE